METPSTRYKFARRVKQIRLKKGLSAQEVANRLHMHLRNYQRIEHRPPFLRYDTIERIAEALEVSLYYLFRF